ncbi:MAG: nucleotidyltransferase domain-containing protein [Spirochaetales bacterium]|nr:nucleotidyltransferase domain-containing protein [Spirochaetales bacterium]
MSTGQNINLFGSKIREAILTVMFLNKNKKYYLREIAHNLSFSPGAVQRELRNLMSLHIIDSEKSGNRIYYHLVEANPIYKDLENIVRKQGGLIYLLKEDMANIKNITVAFIFGSYVSGVDSKDSDIDMFVIGDVSPMELSIKLQKPESIIGREINPYVISELEFKRKYNHENHFIRSVVKDKKIYIKGSDNEIQNII